MSTLAPDVADGITATTGRLVAKCGENKLRSLPSLVLVHSGQGRGKSTAALGTLLRAAAQGWKTAVVEFLKTENTNGEEAMCRGFGVDWFSANANLKWENRSLEESRTKAIATWSQAQELILAGDHRLVVLDEIGYALSWGWIETYEITSTLATRPDEVNVILTGSEMPKPVVDFADTVTEMVKVKHAFDTGIRAKQGIDY